MAFVGVDGDSNPSHRACTSGTHFNLPLAVGMQCFPGVLMTTIPLGPQSCAGPNPPDLANPHKRVFPVFGSRREAALYWYSYGFAVIPVLPSSKKTFPGWNQWLANLSRVSIITHWTQHPNHDVGFIVGNDTVVLDADAPQSVAALDALEARFGIKPMLVVKTSKGVHHYFRCAAGTFATSDSHSTAVHPDRIDVKTGRSMVVLPPSPGKTIVAMGGCDAN